MEKIIDSIDKELIASELTPERLLRRANRGGNDLYVVDAHNAPNTMREIGRLREIAFRDAGGGTGLSCDIDEFDTMEVPCRQLIVWDPVEREILGGYRFILGQDVRVEGGVPQIATSHLFRFSPRFIEEYLPYTLELGRSFVVPTFQSTKVHTHPKAIYVLDNLWDGLGALTVIYPQVRHLFGKFTMYPAYGREARDMILGFLYRYFHDTEELVTPIHPLPSAARSEQVQQLFGGEGFKEDYRTLNHAIRSLGKNIPPLVNAYMSLSPAMKVFGTAVNSGFGDVEETGIFMSLCDIFEDKKRRHIQSYIDRELKDRGHKETNPE